MPLFPKDSESSQKPPTVPISAIEVAHPPTTSVLPPTHTLPPKLTVPPIPHPTPFRNIDISLASDGLLLRQGVEGEVKPSSGLLIKWGLRGALEEVNFIESATPSITVFGLIGILEIFQCVSFNLFVLHVTYVFQVHIFWL
jgi:phosphatidylinositol 4-phosphatase